MKATVVQLRYRMRDVLKALSRGEQVSVLYHGQVKGIITPALTRPNTRVSEQPFFGMVRRGPSVDAVMDALRGGRHGKLKR